MKLYLVVGQDRHIDTHVRAHKTLDGAISAAVAFLDVCARHWERPADPVAAGFATLPDSMRHSGWHWHLRTYDDGPSARVELTEVGP